jgi:hypothetical protein
MTFAKKAERTYLEDYIVERIASGKEQVRPRNDIVYWWVKEIIFLRTLKGQGDSRNQVLHLYKAGEAGLPARLRIHAAITHSTNIDDRQIQATQSQGFDGLQLPRQ